MTWRRFSRRLEDVLKTSSKRLEDVLKTFLQEVLKTSWKRLEDVWPKRIYWSWPRYLEDIFWRRKAKANIFVLIKTSWRRLLKTKTKDVFKTSSSKRMFAGTSLDSTFWVTWRKGMKTREAPDFFLLGWWRGYGKIWIARFL